MAIEFRLMHGAIVAAPTLSRAWRSLPITGFTANSSWNSCGQTSVPKPLPPT
jgi:hypothetical protein